MAAYSAAPLAKKLGIKDGFRIRLVGASEHYLSLLAPLPPRVPLCRGPARAVDLWHVIGKSLNRLRAQPPKALASIRQSGMIRVSWPKKVSGVATDVTEDRIRELALPLGLLDVKVCAIDDVWSGLKLVIRRENRK
jgi:hypothetical protein